MWLLGLQCQRQAAMKTPVGQRDDTLGCTRGAGLHWEDCGVMVPRPERRSQPPVQEPRVRGAEPPSPRPQRSQVYSDGRPQQSGLPTTLFRHRGEIKRAPPTTEHLPRHFTRRYAASQSGRRQIKEDICRMHTELNTGTSLQHRC